MRWLWTYFVGAADHTGLVKIGRAIHVDSRLHDLQSGSPVLLSVWGVIEGDHEAELHRQFAERRKHREWFDLSYRAVRRISAPHVSAERLPHHRLAMRGPSNLRSRQELDPATTALIRSRSIDRILM